MVSQSFLPKLGLRSRMKALASVVNLASGSVTNWLFEKNNSQMPGNCQSSVTADHGKVLEPAPEDREIDNSDAVSVPVGS